MITSRMQNKISGTISGWYSSDWGSTIVWHGQHLMVKDADLADEIAYNLKEDGYDLMIASPTSTEFQGWASAISFQ